MEQVGKFKMYSSEEVLDKHFGKVGTPRRDEFERSVAATVHAYELGEAIKKARLQQNLTQEELGKRVGYRKGGSMVIAKELVNSDYKKRLSRGCVKHRRLFLSPFWKGTNNVFDN